MKILIASTPATGRLNPLLAIGHILVAEDHEVVGLTGSAFRERIENIGAEIPPLSRGRGSRSARLRFGGSRTENHSPGAGLVARRHGACVRRCRPCSA